MANNRKLQGELDRTLKKVDEGIELFEGVWDKIYSATNSAHKEKFESDLKKEIKKLQRLRDQLKTWLAGNEFKDKNQITEYKARIERKMEQFKICERETKTKAFSKEGLAKAEQMNPAERKRMETLMWVQDSLQSLADEVERAEADIEALETGNGKKETRAELEEQIRQHNWHIEKLEMVIRALDNEEVDPEDVDNLRDDVDYYLESYKDPDFFNNEELYDELNLEVALAAQIMPTALPLDAGPVPDNKKKKDDMSTSTATGKTKTTGKKKKKKDDKDKKEALSAHERLVAQQQERQRLIAEEEKKLEQKLKDEAKLSTTASVVASPSTVAPDEPLTMASAISASSSVADPPMLNSSVIPPVTPLKTFSQIAKPAEPIPMPVFGTAQVSIPSTPVGIPSSPAASVVAAPSLTQIQKQQQLQEEAAKQAPVMKSFKAVMSGGSNGANSSVAAAATTSVAPVPSAVEQILGPERDVSLDNVSNLSIPSTVQNVTSVQPPAPHPVSANSAQNVSNGPWAWDDFLDGEETEVNLFDAATRSALFLSSFLHMPTDADAEDPFHGLAGMDEKVTGLYKPENPIIGMPSCFPVNPVERFTLGGQDCLENEEKIAAYEKLDLDTLFFLFYHEQATAKQYMAAKELKKKAWRFHKQYLTWFLRHHDPVVAQDTFEIGTYVYFDHETSWTKKSKENFTFEYQFLEDEFHPTL